MSYSFTPPTTSKHKIPIKIIKKPFPTNPSWKFAISCMNSIGNSDKIKINANNLYMRV